MNFGNNPYTSNPNRLADIVAAIQFMGSFRFYKLDIEAWAKRIEGNTSRAEHWKRVFLAHPEFFRVTAPRTDPLDSLSESDRLAMEQEPDTPLEDLAPKELKASLVWRRAFLKLYDVDT